ncbi:MAG: hypothetical protein AVDCRST_MAG03-2389, partial [uncultured Rubrobacteraceae bacterium]
GHEGQDAGGGARWGGRHARAFGFARVLEKGRSGLRHRPDAGGRPRGGGVHPGGVLTRDPAGAGRGRAHSLRRQHRGRLRPPAPGARREGRGGGRRLLARHSGLGGRVGELAAARRRPLAPLGATNPEGPAARDRPRRLRRGLGLDLLRPDARPSV